MKRYLKCTTYLVGQIRPDQGRPSTQYAGWRSRICFGMILALSGISIANAYQFSPEDQDLSIRWDNTVKYSGAYRVMKPSTDLDKDVNLSNGDNNLRNGFVSNRADLLSEFDASYKNVGMRLSGASWYDSVYDSEKFDSQTKVWMGKNAELLDGFAYGKANIGNDMEGSIRAGRHSILWGETLFMGANGIAGAQQPIDLIKLLMVPSSQFKEIIRPVNQVSAQLQINRNLSVGAYYQLEWRQSLIPPSGSFLSNVNFVGYGSQFLYAGNKAATFVRGPDMPGQNSGQGGLELKYRIPSHDLDLGLYAVRFNDKAPTLYVKPSTMQLMDAYHDGVQAYGVSASTTIGDWNVATEFSGRVNQDLVDDPQVIGTGVVANNNHNPLYPVGDTLHGNLSGIYLFGRNMLWDGGSFLGEAGWNHLIAVTENKAALETNTTRDALATRFIMEPSWFQVIPGLDISAPIGLGYNPYGRSAVLINFNGGTEYGGDWSIGLKGNYENTWKFGLTYTSFFGPTGGWLKPLNGVPNAVISFKQSLADRDFVAFNIMRTF
jgi:Protein of unknown function (DUF1302)